MPVSIRNPNDRNPMRSEELRWPLHLQPARRYRYPPPVAAAGFALSLAGGLVELVWWLLQNDHGWRNFYRFLQSGTPFWWSLGLSTAGALLTYTHWYSGSRSSRHRCCSHPHSPRAADSPSAVDPESLHRRPDRRSPRTQTGTTQTAVVTTSGPLPPSLVLLAWNEHIYDQTGDPSQFLPVTARNPPLQGKSGS